MKTYLGAVASLLCVLLATMGTTFAQGGSNGTYSQKYSSGGSNGTMQAAQAYCTDVPAVEYKRESGRCNGSYQSNAYQSESVKSVKLVKRRPVRKLLEAVVPARYSGTSSEPATTDQSALPAIASDSREIVAIDPRAQAWAEREAALIASRGSAGYRRNAHPSGNNPYASFTGSGFGSDQTCNPWDDGGYAKNARMILVAEAKVGSAVVRSWKPSLR